MTLEERLQRYLWREPQIHPSAYVSKYAVLVGDVEIAENASVWPACVLRADINSIKLGKNSNVQDGTMVHLANDAGVEIGENTTIGHGAIIHACKIGNNCLIGMGATILDYAEIGDNCIIGANALVTKGSKIPAGSMVLGAPAKVVKELDAERQEGLKHWAEKYVELARANKEYESKH